MITTTERPTEGQFVAYWMHDGKIWADTFKWIDGSLERHVESRESNEEEDYWTPEGEYVEGIVFTYVVME